MTFHSLFMNHLGDLIIWLAAVSVLWLIVRKVQRRIHIVGFKQKHGCKDSPCYPHRILSFGTDLLKERMEALKEGRLSRLYQHHFNLYGKTFVEKIGSTVTINTMQKANVQQVLALSFNDYSKDQGQIRAQWPFLGPSIFTDGPHWKSSRALIRPSFAHAELSDLQQIQSYVDRMLDMIPVDGTEVDMQPLLQKLFLDASMDFIFGKSLNALQPEMPEECTKLIKAFDNALQWTARRKQSKWLALWHRRNPEWETSYTCVHRFVDEQIQQALKRPRNMADTQVDNKSGRKRYVLIEELLQHIRDPVELRYQLLGVFLPSRETTAALVGNALFQLARHPNIWHQLRQAALGIDNDNLTLEDLRALTSFRHVLYETLRMIGPSLRVVRVANRDTVLPVGGGTDAGSPMFVARHTRVSVNLWCLHHDRDVWIEDVDVFQPSRWQGHKTPWAFVPFSGGPRVCPAQQQVFTHATYILVRLTQKFLNIENRDSTEEFLENFPIATQSRNGIKVAFRVSGCTKASGPT